MPGKDKTGPQGMGPMTGRKAGFCTDADLPEYETTANFTGGFGCGRGLGRGCGRGYRRIFYATGLPRFQRYGTPASMRTNETGFDEKTALSNQAIFLENQLHQIKNRLAGLSSDTE